MALITVDEIKNFPIFQSIGFASPWLNFFLGILFFGNVILNGILKLSVCDSSLFVC